MQGILPERRIFRRIWFWHFQELMVKQGCGACLRAMKMERKDDIQIRVGGWRRRDGVWKLGQIIPASPSFSKVPQAGDLSHPPCPCLSSLPPSTLASVPGTCSHLGQPESLGSSSALPTPGLLSRLSAPLHRCPHIWDPYSFPSSAGFPEYLYLLLPPLKCR